MSIFTRLRRIRTLLAVGVTLRAAAWGVATGASLFLGAAVIDRFAPLDADVRRALLVIALATALVVMGALLWRDRSVAVLDRVALWLEEQDPALEYTLVSAVETGNEAMVPRALAASWESTTRRRVLRVIAAPAATVVVLVVLLAALPGGAVARMRSPRTGDLLDRPGPGGRATDNRLVPLVATVTPPEYSGKRSTTIEEPADIRTLVGSTVTLRGRGDARGVIAVSGADSTEARPDGERWAITLRVGTKASAVRLAAGAAQRIVAIEPVADEPPAVTLVAPARDSVLRVPTGRIALVADATDDLAVTSAAFEYIVSSGQGESFTFKSGTLGAIKPGGTSASMSATLSLESLALKPGDIVHLRAVARDANAVSGPGVGTSETRAFRIARPDEYDSVTVDAAPPGDAEKSVISERMLIILAEALEKRRSGLKREVVVAESRSIAADQKKLRRAVGELVFTRLGGEPGGEEHDEDPPSRAKTMEELLARADSATNRGPTVMDFEGGESPVVAVNKPLLEAYNAMWDAGTQLEMGEPGRALPHMRRALAAIQRARQAERLYLRGRPAAVVIDINRARLQGKDKGSAGRRIALAASDSGARSRAARFIRIVELAAGNPKDAADSLLVLRIEALARQPAFSSALADAANALRGGKSADATSALARARRALAGAPAARDSIARWGIVP